jgi:hypothetical protein
MSDNEELIKDSKWLKQIKEVREIKKEILEFGISQFQILKLIESLSFELDDRSVMLAIKDALRTAIEASELEQQEKKELIL